GGAARAEEPRHGGVHRHRARGVDAAARRAGRARRRAGAPAPGDRAPARRSREAEGRRSQPGAEEAVMRRVLVVDDDSAILEVLEMRLTAMGFDVTATGDPLDAQRRVDNARFDLALVDLRMEPMD